MPDSKITALTSISTSTDPANDPLVIVDVSDTSMAATGTTKKVTLNQLLGASGTATLASATITGALTGQSSASFYTGTALPLHIRNSGTSFTQIGDNGTIGAGTAFIVGSSDASLRFQCSGSEAMRLNATGLGVGVVPSSLGGFGTTLRQKSSGGVGGFFTESSSGASWFGIYSGNNLSDPPALIYPSGGTLRFATTTSVGIGGFATQMTLDASGNVGIGVAPSAATEKTLQIGARSTLSHLNFGNGYTVLANNFIYNSGNKYIANGPATNYTQFDGAHLWYNAPTGTAGNTITLTQAMTLTAGGDLLVGVTSGSNSRVVKAVAAGTTVLEVTGAAGYGSFFQSGDAQGSSSALSIANIGKVVSSGRSINAGGTINASGADYAEYMTKASDFVLSKGGIAGIDANGKLTNVFADAVSFVVKSTDPSYVGNDKWGIDIEGDALEAARQLVDRIAFAGQVPVNVTGAKAGDYIVPVVDGTGIKGIAVSKPTFEQYQLAVGKVIAIDTDGRARIIVKVA